MNIFTQKVNWDALGKTSALSAPVRQHLTKVYSSLTVALLAAAAGSVLQITTGLFTAAFSYLGFFAVLGLVLWFAVTNPKDVNKRFALLLAIAFANGISLAPLIENTLRIDPAIVSTAFLGTTVVFGCFSGAAIFSERRSFLYIGGMLASACSTLFVIGLANLFFRSLFLFNIQLYLGLVVFCGFVVFDTQLIIEKAIQGDKDFVGHSLELFIDFVKIFVRLLILLSKDKKEKKSNR